MACREKATVNESGKSFRNTFMLTTKLESEVGRWQLSISESMLEYKQRIARLSILE